MVDYAIGICKKNGLNQKNPRRICGYLKWFRYITYSLENTRFTPAVFSNYHNYVCSIISNYKHT